MSRGAGSTVAIVLAGGSGSRSGQANNKVYRSVRGLPLMSYSLMALEAAPEISDVIVVVRNGEHAMAEHASESASSTKVRALVVGGGDRHRSEVAGLHAVANLSTGAGLIAIHDGARPFVTADLIADLVWAAGGGGGAIPSVAIDQPLLAVSSAGIGRRVSGAFVRVQTPQVFPAEVVTAAYADATRDRFSGVDTAETVARYSDAPIAVVPADPRNIKVTLPDDFARAHALAADWSPARWISAL